MPHQLQQLIEQLSVIQQDNFRFMGHSLDLGLPQVFGGQMIGQALASAYQTLSSERPANALHGHFLRPGDPHQPIYYQVECLRDGSTFTTRQVCVMQNDKLLSTFLISFHLNEPGFEHQCTMPNVPPPDTLTPEHIHHQSLLARLGPKWKSRFSSHPAIEFRPVIYHHPIKGKKSPPFRQVWLRMTASLPHNPALHQQILAYVSDFHFIPTALQPHGVGFLQKGLQVVTLNHAICFHQPCKLDEWLLYCVDSPIATNGCGYVRGQFFTQQGQLVASTHQEGLLRQQ